MHARNIRSRIIALGVCAILTAGSATVLGAQSATGGYGAGIVAVGLRTDDLVQSAALGLRAGYRAPSGLLFMGEYLYLGRDFYYFDFDGDRSWKKADSWSSVPSGGADRDEWLFSRTRNMAGAAAGFSGALGSIGLYGAGGVALSWLSVTDAEDDYPEFGEAARTSSIGDSSILLAPTLRGGMVYPARSTVAARLSYMLMLERDEDASGLHYLQRNSLLYLGLVFQPGAQL